MQDDIIDNARSEFIWPDGVEFCHDPETDELTIDQDWLAEEMRTLHPDSDEFERLAAIEQAQFFPSYSAAKKYNDIDNVVKVGGFYCNEGLVEFMPTPRPKSRIANAASHGTAIVKAPRNIHEAVNDAHDGMQLEPDQVEALLDYSLALTLQVTQILDAWSKGSSASGIDADIANQAGNLYTLLEQRADLGAYANHQDPASSDAGKLGGVACGQVGGRPAPPLQQDTPPFSRHRHPAGRGAVVPTFPPRAAPAISSQTAADASASVAPLGGAS